MMVLEEFSFVRLWFDGTLDVDEFVKLFLRVEWRNLWEENKLILQMELRINILSY